MTDANSANATSDSQKLMPIIRSRVQFEIIKLEARLQGVHDERHVPIAFRPFGQDLAVTLVRESDEDWEAVTPDELNSEQLTFDKALTRAMNHFADSSDGTSSSNTFDEIEKAYWSVKHSDEREASAFMLFPQSIYELPIKGKPIAFVPNANTLWIVDSERPRMVARLAQAALETFSSEENEKVSPVPYVLDGKRWKAYQVNESHPAFETIRSAHIEQKVNQYGVQEVILESFSDEGSPVAKPFAIGDPQQGIPANAPFSATNWSEGESVLLPRSDYVILQKASPSTAVSTGELPQQAIVNWATLEDVMGSRMQAQELFPERFLIRQFPNAGEWKDLVAKQADPSSQRSNASNPGTKQGFTSTGVVSTPSPSRSTYHGHPRPQQKSSSTGWLIGGCAVVAVLGIVLVGGVFMAILFLRTSSVKEGAPDITARESMQPSQPRIDRSHFPITPPTVTQRRSQTTSPPPEPTKHDPSDVALPELEYTDQSLVQFGVGDLKNGNGFDSSAPEGGVLVGLQIGRCESWGGSICGLRPIYQVGSEYQNGKWLGAGDVSESIEMLAKPGYAVSGIKVKQGLVINAMRLEYQRIGEDGRLDPRDQYAGQWFGGSGGGEKHIATAPSIIVGLNGTSQKELLSLHCQTAPMMPSVEEPFARFEPASRVALPTLGEPQHTTFHDEGIDGGVLVGLRVFTGERWGGVSQALQPIYQVEGKYSSGKLLGPAGTTCHELLAKPGYAIGAINIKSSLVVNCIQVVFYRYADGKLDPTDDYRSDWIGINTGDEEIADANETPIVGLELTALVDIHSLKVEVGKTD